MECRIRRGHFIDVRLEQTADKHVTLKVRCERKAEVLHKLVF